MKRSRANEKFNASPKYTQEDKSLLGARNWMKKEQRKKKNHIQVMLSFSPEGTTQKARPYSGNAISTIQKVISQ